MNSHPTTSDLESYRDLLMRTGIVFTEELNEGRPTITVTAKTGPKNTGYRDFVSVLVFDPDGSLVEWGCWE